MAIRGVEKNNMMERQKIFRDVRPWHIQFAETLRSVEVTGLIYVTLIGLLFFMPASFELVLFLSIALYPLLKKTEVSIAFRKRMSLHEIDAGIEVAFACRDVLHALIDLQQGFDDGAHQPEAAQCH